MPDDAHPTSSTARQPNAAWRRYAVAACATAILMVVLLLGMRGGAAPVPDALPWLHDADAAMHQAAETRKPVMLFFTADWCGPCQRFKRDVLHQPQVREAIEATVVPVKVDLTNPDMPTRGFAQRYEVEGIPDLLLTDAQGRVLSRLDRSLDADGLVRWIRQVASSASGAAPLR